MGQPDDPQSSDRYGTQSFERPSKRQKVDTNVAIAEQFVTKLQDVHVSISNQNSPLASSRQQRILVQAEVMDSSHQVPRPAVASRVEECPDTRMTTRVAQLTHDESDKDTILFDRLTELTAVDARVACLLARITDGTLSQAESNEYETLCTALTADVKWSIDSWRTRASTGIITPQSLPEIGVVAPKQMNLSHEPQLMSTAFRERRTGESPVLRSPVKTKEIDSERADTFLGSDYTVIQSVEEPAAEINHQFKNTCRKCFRDIPITHEKPSGTRFW